MKKRTAVIGIAMSLIGLGAAVGVPTASAASTGVSVAIQRGSNVIPTAPKGYPSCDVKMSSSFTVSSMKCFKTSTALLASKGIVLPRTESFTALTAQQLKHSGFISVHGDRANLQGAVLSLTGDTCGVKNSKGKYVRSGVSLSDYAFEGSSDETWDNKINSTLVNLPNCDITHFSSLKYKGLSHVSSTGEVDNLPASMINRTSSMSYCPSTEVCP